MCVKTVAEIAGRIKYLEGIKEEYIKRKLWTDYVRIKKRLNELYWTLGVKIE